MESQSTAPTQELETTQAVDGTGGKTPGEEAPPAGLAGLLGNPLVLIAVVLWVWILWNFRKQKKKEKGRKDELDSIRKGDKVITIGRVHGTVVSLTEETMTIKPDPKANGTLTFDRIALHKVIRDGDEKEESKNEAK